MDKEINTEEFHVLSCKILKANAKFLKKLEKLHPPKQGDYSFQLGYLEKAYEVMELVVQEIYFSMLVDEGYDE